MNNILIQDTIRMLQQEVSQDTLIRLSYDEHSLEEVAGLLHNYKLTRARRAAILGCYILISSAIRKHQELTCDNTHDLTKNILDGDYLFGLYYQRLVEQKEFQLLRYLVPAHKRMQIGLIEGKSLEVMYAQMTEQIQQYLDQECTSHGKAHEVA
jgi:hypothetical protein